MCHTCNANKTTFIVGYGTPSTPAAPFGTPSPLGGGGFGAPGAAFGTPAASGAGFGASATPGGFGAPAQMGSSGFGAPGATPGAASPYGGAVSGTLSAFQWTFYNSIMWSYQRLNTAGKPKLGLICCQFVEKVKDTRKHCLGTGDGYVSVAQPINRTLQGKILRKKHISKAVQRVFAKSTGHCSGVVGFGSFGQLIDITASLARCVEWSTAVKQAN